MSGFDSRKLTSEFQDFYSEYYEEEIGELADKFPREKESLYIDFEKLSVFNEDIAADYLSNPESLREYAEEALRLYELPVDTDLEDAHVRIYNVPETTDIRDIRISDNIIGEAIAIKGIVRKATDVQPKITRAAFECQRCGTMNYIPQIDGDYSEPHECQGCERQGPFSINFTESGFIDGQTLKIQESPEGLRGGETPKSINVDVEHDISGVVTPGDHVTIVGVLQIDEGDSQDNSEFFDVYLDCVSIMIEDEEFEDMDITESDVDEIKELAEDKDVYNKMVESISPGIYGYREEKLAMVLQLFSGVTKHLPDNSRIRGDIHMLLIGDPGTGKSMMLSYVGDIAPRSVYTSGKGSSSAGLTAAAVQDDFGDGQKWTLEAGALVLADKGTAAVDELDKMDKSDRSAMHEALEQQTISVAKAGINATLKSRCSLLGAANPKYGRFDEYEPIANQIDLEPALVSRFDLIFTVTDKPDEQRDSKLADHILESNYAGEINTHRDEVVDPNFSEQEVEEASEEVKPAVEPELLRKYIAFAKRNCYPTMTDEAKEKLKDFYVDLRLEGSGEDQPVPITARKLEALVRLSEASARVRLSQYVTEADAKRAVDIVRSCLQDIGVDPETGEFDADVVETGTSKTQRDRIKSIKDLISQMEEEQPDNSVPIDDILDRADEEGLDVSKAEKEIEKLKRKGQIYSPSPGEYQTT